MDITIVGAGNGGTAFAADVKAKGHTVTLLKTSNKGDMEHFSYLKNNNGQVKLIKPTGTITVYLDQVTTDFAVALTSKTELIVIFMPTNYHEKLIQKMVPYLHDKQLILLEPGYLSTAFFLTYAEGIDLTIIEAESSPLDCRITEPGVVTVSFENVCNRIGVHPRERGEEVVRKLESLKYNFKLLQSVVESSLHNPNLIVHTIGGIMSIPRIDYSKGNYWMYKEVFSPTVWNMVLDLDDEKMAILEALNLPKLSYLEACKIRNCEECSTETAKAIFDHYAEFDSVKGPEVSNSRYITEDVPEGLVLLESLGLALDVPTPVCSALITIASSFLQIDFRETGRTIEKLGKEQLRILLES